MKHNKFVMNRIFLYRFRQSTNFWASNASYSVLMIVCIFLTWFKKLWIMFFAENVQSVPKNKFLRLFYDASKQIQSSILARVTIYLLIILIHCSATFIQLVTYTNILTQLKSLHIHANM